MALAFIENLFFAKKKNGREPGVSKGQSSLPPLIEGPHLMLYFNVQRTEKYSIAMCYASCFVI